MERRHRLSLSSLPAASCLSLSLSLIRPCARITNQAAPWFLGILLKQLDSAPGGDERGAVLVCRIGDAGRGCGTPMSPRSASSRGWRFGDDGGSHCVCVPVRQCLEPRLPDRMSHLWGRGSVTMCTLAAACQHHHEALLPDAATCGHAQRGWRAWMASVDGERERRRGPRPCKYSPAFVRLGCIGMDPRHTEEGERLARDRPAPNSGGALARAFRARWPHACRCMECRI